MTGRHLCRGMRGCGGRRRLNLGSHHPRKRMIQYARRFDSKPAAGLLDARLRGHDRGVFRALFLSLSPLAGRGGRA